MLTELRVIPADAMGFVTIRVSELMKNPQLKPVWDFIEQWKPKIWGQHEHLLSFPLTELERSIVVFPTSFRPDAGSTGIIAVFATTKPYDLSRVRDALGMITEMELKELLAPKKKAIDPLPIPKTNALPFGGSSDGRAQKIASVPHVFKQPQTISLPEFIALQTPV